MLSLPDHFAPDDASDVIDAIVTALSRYDPASLALLRAALERTPDETVSFGEIAQTIEHPTQWVTFTIKPNGECDGPRLADDDNTDSAAARAVVTLVRARADALDYDDVQRVGYYHACAAALMSAVVAWVADNAH